MCPDLFFLFNGIILSRLIKEVSFEIYFLVYEDNVSDATGMHSNGLQRYILCFL